MHDPSQPVNETLLEDRSSVAYPIKYVRQTMGGGSPCLITGQPRTAELWFTCLTGVQQNALLSVKEFPTCNYRAVIHATLLCKHPDFVPPPHDIRIVDCRPLVLDSAAVGSSSGARMAGDAEDDLLLSDTSYHPGDERYREADLLLSMDDLMDDDGGLDTDAEQPPQRTRTAGHGGAAGRHQPRPAPAATGQDLNHRAAKGSALLEQRPDDDDEDDEYQDEDDEEEEENKLYDSYEHDEL